MGAPDTSTIAVLAEKPSVARDIARVLGANKQGDGYLQGNGYVVTWAVGHLATLAQPHEINPEWRRWRSDLLPMLPEYWPLVIYEKTRDQFEIVRKILNSQRVSLSHGTHERGFSENNEALMVPEGSRTSVNGTPPFTPKSNPKSRCRANVELETRVLCPGSQDAAAAALAGVKTCC